jgi:hypothetical protein
MRKGLSCLGVLALVIAMALPASAGALEVDVRFAPLATTYAPPAIGSKQGWLAISNRDWQPYTIVIEKKGRASLYQGSQSYPGMESYVIPSGATTTLALEKDTWEFRGNNNDKLKVKVREGRTSTMSLEPFGPAGNTGLRGVTNDGEKVRNEILFNNYYEPPVVIQPPTIIAAPPPPPVIVTRPPVVVHRPPVVIYDHRHRPHDHHRPPLYRNRGGDRRGGGLNFHFNFD